jgi:hypothetical protein
MMLDGISEQQPEKREENNLNLLALTTVTVTEGNTTITIRIDDKSAACGTMKPLDPGAGASAAGAASIGGRGSCKP